MFIIVLNESNLVNDSGNNTLVYKFPNSITVKDKYIAISSASLYYSWSNIRADYLNNIINLNWNGVAYQIIIPDGLYEFSDINNLLQYFSIENGLYLINSVGENVYYFEIEVNPNRIAVQLNTFQVPTVLPAGFTAPANWVGFPAQTFNPVISFPNKFNTIIGYSPINGVVFSSNSNINNAYVPPASSVNNYYVKKDNIGTLSYISNVSPRIQPNSSLYVSISNVNNPYSIPSSIIYSITPSVAIGQLITERPPNFMWGKMIDGTYNELRLQLLGLDNRPIQMNDPQMTFLLCIRDANEGFMGTK
jgi:hypothetical protein